MLAGGFADVVRRCEENSARHLVEWVCLEVCGHRRRTWLVGCVGLQDVCRERPVVCCCVDEVLKQRDVADVVVAVDPGGEFNDGGHGLTNSAQIAWSVPLGQTVATMILPGDPHGWQVPMDIAICSLWLGGADLDGRWKHKTWHEPRKQRMRVAWCVLCLVSLLAVFLGKT